MGITGANAVGAIDGALVLAHSQGNTTLVSSRPIHIALIGLEKLVPTLTEAIAVTHLQGLFETGANGARFYNIIEGPSKFPTVGGTRGPGYTTKDLHLIFLDNNRSRIANSESSSLLHCIRCFTCNHHCPPYHVLGPGRGTDFEDPGFGVHGYIGGREIVHLAHTYDLPTAVSAGLYACTLCGACYQVCPLEIDIPYLIRSLRKSIGSF